MTTLLDWLPVAALVVAAAITLIVTLRVDGQISRSFEEIEQEQREIRERLDKIGFRP